VCYLKVPGWVVLVKQRMLLFFVIMLRRVGILIMYVSCTESLAAFRAATHIMLAAVAIVTSAALVRHNPKGPAGLLS